MWGGTIHWTTLGLHVGLGDFFFLLIFLFAQDFLRKSLKHQALLIYFANHQNQPAA